MRILVIEDDPFFVETLRAGLVGQEVEAAYTMTKGLEMLQTRLPYDRVLVDLMLPDSDPEDTIQKLGIIRAAAPKLGIIVMTGYVSFVNTLKRAGVTRGLLKGTENFLSDLWGFLSVDEEPTTPL